eukprot:15377800-Heterocapsa_arctica.AAC.1
MNLPLVPPRARHHHGAEGADRRALAYPGIGSGGSGGSSSSNSSSSSSSSSSGINSGGGGGGG